MDSFSILFWREIYNTGALPGYKNNLRHALKSLSLNYRAIRIYVLTIILLSMTNTRPRPPVAARRQRPVFTDDANYLTPSLTFFSWPSLVYLFSFHLRFSLFIVILGLFMYCNEYFLFIFFFCRNIIKLLTFFDVIFTY